MAQLYDTIGTHYAKYRLPDPRIAAAILAAIGDARRIVNLGAGTGSYEPTGWDVIAVEPSETMIRQRPAGAAPVIRGSAMSLPFRDGEFDAALALLTIHHWPDQDAGLREMSRVARRCIVFTWDNAHQGMWLTRDYFPKIVEHGRTICPPIDHYRTFFDRTEIHPLLIPYDCSDGFLQAYWRRPEVYFDAQARSAISAFTSIDAEFGLKALRRDLDDGTWARRNGTLMNKTELDLGYRLVIGERA